MIGKLLITYFPVINNSCNSNFTLLNMNFWKGLDHWKWGLPDFIIGFIFYYHSKH